jgi:glutamate dehydrogenase/leucine dehydrogenase
MSGTTLLGPPADAIGPHKIVIVRDPGAGLEAVVVVDNVACGPAIGGVRMATDVTLEEVARLARAMTLKNAAAALPHGGGKAGILADPKMEPAQKEGLIRAFARAIRDISDYIPGPDMGTDETCMAWVKDEIGRSVGIPSVLGGIPIDEIGATAFGLAISAEVAQDFAGIRLDGSRVAIQGFGAVGKHAARFLQERGAVIVAVADSRGATVNPEGLSLPELLELKSGGHSVSQFPGGRCIPGDDLVGVDCDVWVPAARPDVLTADNVSRLKAKLVLQGANIPATPEAEEWLHAHNILSIPDFIANAGGVISASVEYHGGSQSQAFALIEEKVRANTRAVLEKAYAGRITPRRAAEQMAEARVMEAARYHRS